MFGAAGFAVCGGDVVVAGVVLGFEDEAAGPDEGHDAEGGVGVAEAEGAVVGVVVVAGVIAGAGLGSGGVGEHPDELGDAEGEEEGAVGFEGFEPAEAGGTGPADGGKEAEAATRDVRERDACAGTD